LGLAPLQFLPKEALAIMNGTSAMTGLACLAWERAEFLVRLCSRLTSLASFALNGNVGHFHPVIFKLKPHPGQAQVANFIAQDLELDEDHNEEGNQIQDRYSIRCAPHVIGVLADGLPFYRQLIETELNSSNDNPLLDVEAGRFHHGGNFYGGHICLAMDAMKASVANLLNLMDRQMALLVDCKTNNGLPSNLTAMEGPAIVISHGFKAVQIAISALAAEASKLTMPASVFTRSTECHNQDIVSMGTIAARDAHRILALTEQGAACMLMAAVQAVELRLRETKANLHPRLRQTVEALRGFSAPLVADRSLDKELASLTLLIRQQGFPLEPL